MTARSMLLASLAIVCGCGLQPPPEPPSFSLNLESQWWNDAFVGQQVVLILTVEEETDQPGDAVALSATAPGCDVALPRSGISAGEVAEVWITPQALPNETTVTATVRGVRGDVEQTAEMSFIVFDEEHGLEPYASQLRDRFVEWLSENRPELDITAETEWTGTIVQPRILVVSHYLFFSEEWEMGVEWHIMIPPYDWGRIYLRRRFSEASPSAAFEISSLSDAAGEPYEIDPQESVFR